jgi:hypothetical protein
MGQLRAASAGDCSLLAPLFAPTPACTRWYVRAIGHVICFVVFFFFFFIGTLRRKLVTQKRNEGTRKSLSSYQILCILLFFITVIGLFWIGNFGRSARLCRRACVRAHGKRIICIGTRGVSVRTEQSLRVRALGGGREMEEHVGVSDGYYSIFWPRTRSRQRFAKWPDGVTSEGEG